MASSALTTALAGLACCLAIACARAPAQPEFHAEGFPERLSEWGVFSMRGDALALNDGVEPYELATPLFSDYALKLRTVSVPEGRRAAVDAQGAIAFPVGSIVTKTFYYPQRDGVFVQSDAPRLNGRKLALEGVRLVETRVLVRRADGWIAIPYVWNESQDDAVLSRTGAAIAARLERADGRIERFTYIAPDQNQCAGCHATARGSRALAPIGLAARHLDRPDAHGGGQLQRLQSIGLLERAPKMPTANADWSDTSASLDARARAYLDINCSHCHSDVGPASTSGLDLRPDRPLGPAFGLCKSPVAAGAGTGGRRFDIEPGAPERSIFVYRLKSAEPGEMMPELGRALVHEEGAMLIETWIKSLKGRCA